MAVIRTAGIVFFLCWMLFANLVVGAAPSKSCAIVADRSDAASNFASLVEIELLRNDKVRVVDRKMIAAVFNEASLQATLSPSAIGERATVGKRLQAELLVFIGGNATDPKFLNVVVCETAMGLRLADVIVQADNPTAAVATVATAVTTAARLDVTKSEICAVPPFVNADLVGTFAPLSAAYAAIAERVIARHDGYVVVELQEARAVADEIAIAGAANVRRKLPLYVDGEYRTTLQRDGRRRVAFRLMIRRGQATVASVERSDLDPPMVARVLEDAITELLKTQDKIPPHRAAPNFVVSDEAAMLASRSETFRHLGNWSEAMTMVEASLLIEPDQPALHRHAVYIITNWLGSPKEGLALFTQPIDFDRRVELSRLGLDHLEAHLRLTTARPVGGVPDPAKSTDATVIHTFFSQQRRLSATITARRAEAVTAADAPAETTLASETLAMVRRVLADKQRRGVRDDIVRYVCQSVDWTEGTGDVERGFANKLKIAADFPSLLGSQQDIAFFFTVGIFDRNPGRLDSPELRRALDQLATLPDPACRQAASNMTRRLDTGLHPRGSWPPLSSELQPTTLPATVPSVPTGVRFVPLRLTARDARSAAHNVGPVVGWIGAGKGVEALWSRTDLYLMTKPHQPKWLTKIGATGVCFDGKFIWATAPGKRLALLVIDPRTLNIRTLPLPAEVAPVLEQDAFFSSRTLMTGLSPGRICIAGGFGRGWIGTMTYDEVTGVGDFNVFFMARRLPEQSNPDEWRDKNIAFTPFYMTTLTAPAADPTKGPTTRVVLGREGGHAFNSYHPLSIDVETKNVEVIEDDIRIHPNYPYFYDDGAFLYWVDWNAAVTNMYRLGPSDDMHRKAISNVPFRGSIGRTTDGFLIDGRPNRGQHKWAFAPSLAGPYVEMLGEQCQATRLFYSQFHGTIYSGVLASGVYEVQFDRPSFEAKR